MALLVSQKNEIYSLIEEMDFSPAQFIFEEIPSRYDAVPTALQLAYAPKPEYNFRFDRRVRRELHYVSYSPGMHDIIDEANPGADWFMVKAYLKEWIRNLARELGQPDRWQSLAVILADDIPRFDEDPIAEQPFSVPEYKALCERFEEVSERLPETGLEEHEIEVIRLKFERIKQKAENMSRGDWQSMFLGSIVGTIGQLGLSGDSVRALWNLLRSVFQNLILG